jgi:hypothetical protein
MLLAALVACAGVTMTAVATALEAPERAGYRGGPLEHGGHPLQCQYQLIPLFAFVAHAALAISEEAGEGATASRTVRLLALQRFDPPLRVLKRIFPALRWLVMKDPLLGLWGYSSRWPVKVSSS